MSENLRISILKIELPLFITVWEEESQFFYFPLELSTKGKERPTSDLLYLRGSVRNRPQPV